MNLLGRLLGYVRDIFVAQKSVEEKKIDKDIQANENQNTIQKMELESTDDFISRTRTFIIRAAFIALILDGFGVRVYILNKLGIPTEAVNYDRIINLMIDIISSALVSS